MAQKIIIRLPTRNRLNWYRKLYFTIPLLMLPAVIIVSGWTNYAYRNAGEAKWELLHRANRSTKSGDEAKRMEERVESIMKIFQKAQVFNPPKGFAVVPRVEYLRRISFPGHTHSPEPVHFRVAVRMPPESKDIVAGVNVWINEPYNLLGDPVLSDNEGEMFLLPPEVGRKEGEKIYSRSGHPPGYEESYPSKTIFPLWADNQEPFLRSVVRPTFGLSKQTVTTLYTLNERPFWKPVSQERWIKAMISRADKQLEEFKSGLDAAEKTELTQQQINQMRSYVQKMKDMWDENAIRERHDKMKEQLMPLYEMMKQRDPAEAEKFYQNSIVASEKQMEETIAQSATMQSEIAEMERKIFDGLLSRDAVWTETAASIKQGNWDKLEKLAGEYKLESLILLADAGRALQKMNAELASLTPAQRRASAYGFLIPEHHPLGPHRQVVAMTFTAERASGLVDAGAKGARAIVCPDPDFFNFSEKDAPIYLMAIEYWGSNRVTYDNGKRNLPDDIWRTLDWQALRAMVK